MRVRKLTDEGYANRALLTIAQIGMIRRSELSQTLYTVDENGEMISGVGSVGLTRGIKRLRDHGYIETVKYENADYYYVTKEGWSYIQKNYPTIGYRMSGWRTTNKTQLNTVAKRAIGLYLYHTIGISTLPSEKPSLATLCNNLAGTHILDDVEQLEGYDQEADVKELFDYGVYYDIQEIRDTFRANGDVEFATIKTIARGILINAQEIIFVYHMNEKRAVFFGQVENDFMTKISNIFERVYEAQNGSPSFLKVCNIIATDLRYLPTLVTGKTDGIQKKQEETELYTLNQLSVVCAKRLLFFDKIQIMPRMPKLIDYRGNQYDYGAEDYEADLARCIAISDQELVRVIGPEKSTLENEATNEKFIICRYPDIKELFQYHTRYIEKREKISVIGIDDPSIADFISRSLQCAIDKYYSIETMKEIPIAHYNEEGLRETSGKYEPVYINNLFVKGE